MRRKIFICFFVVLLMTTMVVPAFASSDAAMSYTSSDSPAIPIDYIELLDGTHMGAIADWPNNFGKGTSQTGVFCSYPFAEFVCYRSKVASSGGIFDTNVYTGDTSAVRLFCSNIFLVDSVFFELNDYDLENVTFSNVSVSGSYHLPYKDNKGGYAISSTSFSENYTLNSDRVDIIALLKQAAHTGDVLPNGCLWFQDVTITFSFFYDDPDLPRCFNVSVSNSKFFNGVEYWFNAYKLKYTVSSTPAPELPSMFDWLLDSVNAFLNFEIAPNFTLNKLFFIVLVIGVLLWFIALLT